MRKSIAGILAGLILLPNTVIANQAETSTKRPNIVFILADDLGFSDTAPYGGEINTPTLSALAKEGVQFTNYHTAANCAPARAMLLTGVSNHLAGVPNIPEMLAPEQKVASNYQGVLGDNVVTVASLLENAGYNTYMAGKWHLGMTLDKLPSRRGFKRTVAMMDSGADNWEQRPYLPIYDQANWFADGERYTLPDDFYSSKFLIDKMIAFIDDDRATNKPFFAYLPFMAVHTPVQAPKEFTDRYITAYEGGWSALRQRRLQRAIELGFVPADTKMVEMATTEDWDALSDERKRFEAKRMAVYAGMIEAMDYHIGRLVLYLKKTSQYDNTIFIFTSDNGSEASGANDLNSFSSRRMTSSLGYNVDYETLGEKGSYNSIGPSFASASASPLAYFKFYTGEGGLRVPLLIAGNSISNKGSITPTFAWATDITPTILSLAGVAAPQGRFGGRPVEPISGHDLSLLLRGQAKTVRSDEEYVGYELTGHAALFKGDYKIVVNQGPVGDGQWRMYNLAKDPGETMNLAAKDPARFQKMLSDYEQFKKNNKVQPIPEGYSQLKQIMMNGLRDNFGTSFVILLLTSLFLLPFFVGYRIKKQRQ